MLLIVTITMMVTYLEYHFQNQCILIMLTYFIYHNGKHVGILWMIIKSMNDQDDVRIIFPFELDRYTTDYGSKSTKFNTVSKEIAVSIFLFLILGLFT